MSATWDCLKHQNMKILGDCSACLEDEKIHFECNEKLNAAREDYKWLRRNYDENKMLVTDYTAMKAERDRLKNLLEMSEQTRKADIKDLKQMLKNRQKRMSKYREALENIRAIAFDGDGLATAEDLGKDIAELAKAALQSHTSARGEDAPSEEKRK